MSVDLSATTATELTSAVDRNLASYTSQQWADVVSAVVRSGGDQAAAHLAPGESVEWMTVGIVHKHQKTWPEAILLVTPHRLIVSVSRGRLRTKREVNSLYRGPESLLGVAHRLLPGSSADYWTLEIATQDGPVLFAIPPFVGAESMAHVTATFLTGRARYSPSTGPTIDGEPWTTLLPPATDLEQTADHPALSADDLPEDAMGDHPPDVPLSPFGDLPAEVPAPEPAVRTSPVPVQRSYAAPTLDPVPELAEPAPLATDPGTDRSSESGHAAASAPPADWYPDPLEEASLRYWDGTSWTQSTAG